MNRALAIALLLAAALLHWPGEGADFSYDDIDFVVSNASLRSWDSAASAMFEPFPPEQRERGLYRPLTNFSYFVDFTRAGLDATAFHRTNVALYAAVVLAAGSFYLCTLPSAGLAFGASVVFAFHPAHSEAVDSVAGRSELLALLFALLALRLFEAARAAAGKRASVLSAGVAALYALACLSKETAVVLPGILAARLLIAEWPDAAAQARVRRDRWIALLAPSALVLVAYLVLRSSILGAFTPGMRILAGESLATRSWTAGAVYAEYLRILVWPRILQLDFYYQAAVGIVRTPDLRAGLGLAAAGAILVAYGCGLRSRFARAPATAATENPDRHGREFRIAALTHASIALAFFFPVSHVIEIGALMAERFLFAPSLGLAALVCLAATALGRRLVPQAQQARSLVAIFALGLGLFVVASATRSVARASEWRDGVALWQSAARLLPQDSRVHANLGKQLLARDEFSLAEASFARALELEPGQQAAMLNMGVLREAQGRDGEALETYRRLLNEWPDDFVAWNNRGVVEARSGLARAAQRSFERALSLNSNHAGARQNRDLMRERIAELEGFLESERIRAEEARDPELARALAKACRALEENCALHFERLERQIERDARSGD